MLSHKSILIITIIICLIKLSTQQIRYGAQDCINKCFNVHPDWFYCSTGDDFGWCCPDTSRTECQHNTANQIYCSNGATSHNYAKYAFCPRKTKSCGTPGPKMLPLLNVNQSFSVVNTINQTDHNVCWWQLYVNTTQWLENHPIAPLNETFIYVTLFNRTNLNVFFMQGTTRKNAKNVTNNPVYNRTYRYPLSSGDSIFIIAYPSDQTKYTQNNLTVYFNITTSIYPVEGISVEYQALYTANYYDEDMTTRFWQFVEAGLAIGGVILITGIILICVWNFDKYNAFEKRRAKLAKKYPKTKDYQNIPQKNNYFKENKESEQSLDVPSEGSNARSTVRQKKSKNSDDEGNGVEEIEMRELEKNEKSLRISKKVFKDQDY